jgi:hypothetical protein
MEVSVLTAVTKTPIFTTALLTSVVSPYLLYAFTYFFPDAFHRVMRQNTLVAVTSIAKAIAIPLYLIEALSAGINWSGCVIGLPMVLVGQFLNYLVYRRLGKVRAYYGWELSLFSGPMLTDFPFNLEHAQYKGLILCIFGTFCLYNPTERMGAVTALWIALYFFVTLFESFPSGRKTR